VTETPTDQEGGYWIIPPDIFVPLNEKYHFDFDPTPYPRPKDFDGLSVEWGQSNWVNPLFQNGWAKWGHKAISEYRKGKTIVMILPMSGIQIDMLRAGAELLPVGPIRWLHTDGSGRSMTGSYPDVLWIFDPKRKQI
jgi:hypothetical protein